MNEVLEYLFFTQTIADQFIDTLHEHDLHFEREIEPVQGAIVLKIAEGVDDDLWDKLDDLYDELSEADQALVEAGIEDTDSKSTAGIYLQLSGGHQTIAQVDPNVMARMLAVITTDELNAFVDTIVRSVETPDDSPICKR
ncbi:MAG: hypothetical protein QJT81_11350 [Candidatus Thiothrix putei]|uniref:Uncharacterized protein n=2 Tax=Thiothrix TaxID=1030 RepID=A0A1H3ZYC6_9GAMM|nr:hypothetical protein [Thiothrix caldifontis]WGZ92476.1 MAG: hypothetical protein QJT81_11350 [Candidatus Thiothrix putei]SEA28670.1 hypothetical protein SAMN05660964_01266 [Thiothrix caldifontis]